MSVISTRNKGEILRIEAENVRIAKKLMNAKPSLDIKAMENQFHLHKSLSVGLRKIRKKKIPIHEGRAGFLPPIDLLNSETGEKNDNP